MTIEQGEGGRDSSGSSWIPVQHLWRPPSEGGQQRSVSEPDAASAHALTRLLLTAAGAMSLAVALLHLAIIFIGAPGYRYFGAPETFARQAEAGSMLPAVLTLGLTDLFATFGLYGLGGAERFRALPLLRPALVAIGCIYTLRGLPVFPQAWLLLWSPGSRPPREVVFSLVSLITGLLYLEGTRRGWRRMGWLLQGT